MVKHEDVVDRRFSECAVDRGLGVDAFGNFSYNDGFLDPFILQMKRMDREATSLFCLQTSGANHYHCVGCSTSGSSEA